MARGSGSFIREKSYWWKNGLDIRSIRLALKQQMIDQSMIIEGGFINMGREIFWFRTNEPQELGFLPLERNENHASREATFHATFESK